MEISILSPEEVSSSVVGVREDNSRGVPVGGVVSDGGKRHPSEERAHPGTGRQQAGWRAVAVGSGKEVTEAKGESSAAALCSPGCKSHRDP